MACWEPWVTLCKSEIGNMGHLWSEMFNPLTLRAAYLHQCLCHHCSKKWLGAKSAPIHFLNQCLLYIEKKPSNHLRRNSCLILRISLRKIEMKLSSVFLYHISPGLNVLMLNFSASSLAGLLTQPFRERVYSLWICPSVGFLFCPRDTSASIVSLLMTLAEVHECTIH